MKARIEQFVDAGNGTADVVVAFSKDDGGFCCRRSFNFHQEVFPTQTSVVEFLRNEADKMEAFSCLCDTLQELVGQDI